MTSTKEQYKALRNAFARYWAHYGRSPALIKSPVLHVSVVLSIVMLPRWFDESWVSLATSLLPNVLGFSLGTYALVFSLITSRIRLALRDLRSGLGSSYLDELNSLFLHYIITQVLTITFAIVYSSAAIIKVSEILDIRSAGLLALSFLKPVGGFFGTTLLIYSLLSMLTAAFAVYRLASIVDPEVE